MFCTRKWYFTTAKLLQNKYTKLKMTHMLLELLTTARGGSVHDGNGALRLASKYLGEELESQADMDGDEDVSRVHHHSEDSHGDGVEHGALPGLQHVAAGDQQVLVVQPVDIVLHTLHIHLQLLGILRR